MGNFDVLVEFLSKAWFIWVPLAFMFFCAVIEDMGNRKSKRHKMIKKNREEYYGGYMYDDDVQINQF